MPVYPYNEVRLRLGERVYVAPGAAATPGQRIPARPAMLASRPREAR